MKHNCIFLSFSFFHSGIVWGRLNEHAVLYAGEYDVVCLAEEVFFYFEAVGPASAVCSSKQGCAATGAGVDDDIAGIGEYLDESDEQGNGFLRGVYLWGRRVARVVEAVEYHGSVVVELGKFVAVEQDAVFAVSDNLHVCFEDLRGIVFTEHEVDVVLKAVFLAQLDVFELLLELAEDNHTGRFACLLRFFDEHLRAEVHELGGTEVVVGVEECLSGLVAFAVTVVSVDVPRGVAGVCVDTEVIGRVGDDELGLTGQIFLPILK